MTYRDKIVDEVRAIREQLCNKAGSLENILDTLRKEESTHPGRMAKPPAPDYGAQPASVPGRHKKIALPLCAEDRAKYGKE